METHYVVGLHLIIRLCSSIEDRFESVSEMGYTIDNKPFPCGELLVNSIEMFSSYVNNSEETIAAVTNDGFFPYGDIVELQIKDNEKPKVSVVDCNKERYSFHCC